MYGSIPLLGQPIKCSFIKDIYFADYHIVSLFNPIYLMKEWKPSLSFDEITLEYIQLYHNHGIEIGNQLFTIYKKHANFKFLNRSCY